MHTRKNKEAAAKQCNLEIHWFTVFLLKNVNLSLQSLYPQIKLHLHMTTSEVPIQLGEVEKETDRFYGLLTIMDSSIIVITCFHKKVMTILTDALSSDTEFTLLSAAHFGKSLVVRNACSKFSLNFSFWKTKVAIKINCFFSSFIQAIF